MGNIATILVIALLAFVLIVSGCTTSGPTIQSDEEATSATKEIASGLKDIGSLLGDVDKSLGGSSTGK